MTLKQYLVQHRQPDYEGINARAYLRLIADRNAYKTLGGKGQILHLSVDCKSSDIKHTLFKIYLNR